MLLQRGECSATLLRVLGTGQDRERAQQQLEIAADDLGLPPSACTVEWSDNAVASIVRYSEEADLVVLGLGTGAGRRRLFGSFALDVVAGARCPVIAIAQARR